jgi:hypothetical protein
MAAIAMARELDSLGVEEDVDAGAVKRSPKRIAMQGLLPLMIGLLVAVPAVRSIRKGIRLQERVAFDGSISRHRHLAFAEREVVALAYLFGILLALASWSALSVE